MPPENDQNRLDKIERQLGQIKAILLAMLVLLVFGMFAARDLLALVGISVFVSGLIGLIIYLGLRVLDFLLKRRLQDIEREGELELLREIESLKEDDSERPAKADSE